MLCNCLSVDGWRHNLLSFENRSATLLIFVDVMKSIIVMPSTYVRLVCQV